MIKLWIKRRWFLLGNSFFNIKRKDSPIVFSLVAYQPFSRESWWGHYSIRYQSLPCGPPTGRKTPTSRQTRDTLGLRQDRLLQTSRNTAVWYCSRTWNFIETSDQCRYLSNCALTPYLTQYTDSDPMLQVIS